MENNWLNKSVDSTFLGTTSSRDNKTDFYGMMSETNHKILNGYNFLHNSGSSSIDDMDLAFVNMGHIQNIFADELFDSFKKKAYLVVLCIISMIGKEILIIVVLLRLNAKALGSVFC